MANPNILMLLAQGGAAGPNDTFSRASARGAQIDAMRDERARMAEETGRKRNVLEAFPAALRGDENALAMVAQNDPQTAISLQDHHARLAEAKRKETQQRLQRFSGAALVALDRIEGAPEAERQRAYESMIPAVAQLDPEVFQGLGGAPQQYSPEWAAQARTGLLPLALGEEGMQKLLSARMQGGDDTADIKNWKQAQKDGYKGSFMEYQKENKGRGLAITLPDGTTIAEGGPLPTMGKPAQNTLEEKIITSQAGLDRLRGIASKFKPEYQTWEGKLKGGVASLKDKAGVDMTDEDKKYLGDFESYRGDVLNNLNLYIKDITGASMSVQEAGRITRSMPNDDDGPTQFQSKLASTMKNLGRVQARAYYTLAKGLSLDKIGLEQIDDVIRKRGSELEGELKGKMAGASDEDVKTAVKQQLKREFGLAP